MPRGSQARRWSAAPRWACPGSRCLRLRRAGWTLRVAHDVVVHHAGSATFRAAGSYSTAFAHGYRNELARPQAADFGRFSLRQRFRTSHAPSGH